MDLVKIVTFAEDMRERGRFASQDVHARVAAVVVTYNSEFDIPGLIDDLRKTAHSYPVRLIVVDNQSTDRTVERVNAHDDVRLIKSTENLGYAGGINTAMAFIGQCDAVLILNPDLRLADLAVTRLLDALDGDAVGAAVPLMLDEDCTTFHSLRHEPSVTRALGDALFGAKLAARPAWFSEIDSRPSSYTESHDVAWATGAAILIPQTVARAVGEWNEEFFLYSEETDYLRRIREAGWRVRFEPSAVVLHRRGGSGASSELATLMAVNRIRYVERYHGRSYSVLFRAVVSLGEVLRSYDPIRRRRLAMILNRRRWHELLRASGSSRHNL